MKYSVCVPWFASVLVMVEAKDKKEAMEKAMMEAYPGLCYQCSGDINMDGGPDDGNFNEECVEELPDAKND